MYEWSEYFLFQENPSVMMHLRKTHYKVALTMARIKGAQTPLIIYKLVGAMHSPNFQICNMVCVQKFYSKHEITFG